MNLGQGLQNGEGEEKLDCRGLVHLFCYRCLHMWFADCRRFTSEKTNSTLLSYNL
ncbi:hypothetical protein Hanom_Chr10g00913811 [Helianthus anomalus]